MSVVLVVNPAATRATQAHRAAAIAALRPFGLQDVVLTGGSGDAARLAAEAVAAGAGVVVAMGGDGTASEVASALSGTQALMAPLPVGSTNVFARAIGWPRHLTPALAALSRALEHPVARELTLGRLEAGPHDRVFLFNAGFGVDAESVHRVEARPALKRRLRQGWFAAATTGAGVRLAFGAPHMALTVDGHDAGQAVSLIAACGSPYTFLGPRALDLVPDASFDGRLRWLCLRRARPHEVGVIVAGALRGARHLSHKAVTVGWAESEILAEADRPVALQADGEPLGWHRRLRLSPGPSVRALHPPKE